MKEKAKCGHFASPEYASAHGGLCRKCHSNFSFLMELEDKYGEDALVEYWYMMILAHLPQEKQSSTCFIEHLTEFYKRKLVEAPARRTRYIKKMLYMLYSIQEPFNADNMK
jgi:hypothetical protein